MTPSLNKLKRYFIDENRSKPLEKKSVGKTSVYLFDDTFNVDLLEFKDFCPEQYNDN